jgi:tRNA modification GTPase
MTRETISVLLTPPGRGAIATVLVDGPRAAEVVAELFHSAAGTPLVACELGRIVFGRWGGDDGEELVVCRRHADRVEIHGHGGQAAVAAVIDSLAAAGCRNVAWQMWHAAQSEDLIQAQAVEALAKASTDRTASILLDQHAGALHSELEAILRHVEAEDRESLALAEQRLELLRSRAGIGLHLTEPFQIVLAGRPNVGKSSLINALAGYRRSIVYDQPGTTRDVVTVTTALDGWPVELSDTAGLRESADELEAAGIERARASLQQANQRVLVFDASRPWSEEDDSLCQAWPDALLVLNKADLIVAADSRRPRGIMTSATAMTGIEELVRQLSARIVAEAPPPGAAVPFLASHLAAIEKAIDCLSAKDLAGAAMVLRGII